ncbi:BRCA1-A complex subunit Abraxas 1-like [Plodia interpunctella]|uniref:BRCA1-A complex subunit Abraxas 1-like n=1 Tax=Plodia interpunctella TaxID=58824 RepID=UPI00236744E4|nr:BRCA1-A complex subunit Abraxas 1-like [Plodia interpunctella]
MNWIELNKYSICDLCYFVSLILKTHVLGNKLLVISTFVLFKMAYTEKVSLSGTALSFLLYECVNSVNSQEGFLIGDITSEITNHISDSQSDNARLDTQIEIRTVLPLPSVSLFYLPTGKIKEDVLSGLLSDKASEIVGWYKYRKNTNIKPTFRDKLISKGLQKYFERYHGKKTFVTCHLSYKCFSSGLSHTFIYRFGKINCFDMYEYMEDVTANLGEKLTGYKKPHRLPPQSAFNKIVKESNLQTNSGSEAILRIQEAVDVRLMNEAKIAAKNENIIRALEAEIKQMTTILAEKQAADLQSVCNKIIEENIKNRETEMAEACMKALQNLDEKDILDIPNSMNRNHVSSNSDNLVQLKESDLKERTPSPVLMPTSSTKPALKYSSVLKNKKEVASTSKQSICEDLISFDVEDRQAKKPNVVNDEIKCLRDSSPEY